MLFLKRCSDVFDQRREQVIFMKCTIAGGVQQGGSCYDYLSGAELPD
jgi:hypothetical protein